MKHLTFEQGADVISIIFCVLISFYTLELDSKLHSAEGCFCIKSELIDIKYKNLSFSEIWPHPVNQIKPITFSVNAEADDINVNVYLQSVCVWRVLCSGDCYVMWAVKTWGGGELHCNTTGHLSTQREPRVCRTDDEPTQQQQQMQSCTGKSSFQFNVCLHLTHIVSSKDTQWGHSPLVFYSSWHP